MEHLSFDLSARPVRALNQFLHGPAETLAGTHVRVSNPDGAHNIAVGLNAAVKVTIDGHAGYYAAGMNKFAEVIVEGSASTGVAENMMSGKVHVKGFASNSAGASAHGGLLVIDGDRIGVAHPQADDLAAVESLYAYPMGRLIGSPDGRTWTAAVTNASSSPNPRAGAVPCGTRGAGSEAHVCAQR